MVLDLFIKALPQTYGGGIVITPPYMGELHVGEVKK